MEYKIRRAVLLLSIFIGLFFLLQTDITLDTRTIHSTDVSVQSVQMVFRPIQVKAGSTALMKAVSLPAAYLPLYFLFNCRADYFLRGLMAGIWLISFTIYTLHIIYKLDGKKRGKCALLSGTL